MQLKPLGDNIVVKAISREETTKSGIILPETIDKEKPEQGEVIATGPGKIKDDGTRAAMEVKIGDHVLFKKYSPDEVKIDQEKYLVLSQSDVIALIEK
ncbi:MAG: co-chaperone GroES [Candidatus Komeilibacteria bacterium CG_4_10_14_0_2_um_filter_37_10]|uniref:Co-chaperonin GroES n=1 Tax=Candidatus Komeilibacteria bacterium CG_4_10_14_0_2_um_filter_37_10 TaxID=1974470 RepID=A0A2M7VD74_9BACT|nr:MAG: co-chaperone GroES [Candidatus Komeilibacteria bacterium CG_4_10_14_0_2_um_filter_37_10]